jgi:hypothetical protein
MHNNTAEFLILLECDAVLVRNPRRLLGLLEAGVTTIVGSYLPKDSVTSQKGCMFRLSLVCIHDYLLMVSLMMWGL